MTQPRFRVSASYFISHQDEEWAAASAGGFTMDLGERAADEWHEDDMLIVPLLSADGEVLGYLSVDDPVDRRLPSVEIIHQLEVFGSHASTAIESAELYDRLARNNLELSRASEQLKNLNELKSNFVANVSHELRTPLTSIRAYTETLVHNQQAMDDSVRNEFLTVIHQECEKLTAIMDDILDLSRIEDGTMRGHRQECSLMRGRAAAGGGGRRAGRRQGDRPAARSAGGRRAAERRSGADGAGDRASAQQRRQVHAGGRHGPPGAATTV